MDISLQLVKLLYYKSNSSKANILCICYLNAIYKKFELNVHYMLGFIIIDFVYWDLYVIFYILGNNY